MCLAISSRGAERMSSMQSLSAYMLIGLHFPIWIWTLLKWTCLPVHFLRNRFAQAQPAHAHIKHVFMLCSMVRSSINQCRLENAKSWIPTDVFFPVENVTQQILLLFQAAKLRGTAEHTISVRMQISESDAYAKEVTLSQIIRACHIRC